MSGSEKDRHTNIFWLKNLLPAHPELVEGRSTENRPELDWPSDSLMMSG
jgi:hypothetical protein